jgi:hypothetical protein
MQQQVHTGVFHREVWPAQMLLFELHKTRRVVGLFA